MVDDEGAGNVRIDLRRVSSALHHRITHGKVHRVEEREGVLCENAAHRLGPDVCVGVYATIGHALGNLVAAEPDEEVFGCLGVSGVIYHVGTDLLSGTGAIVRRVCGGTAACVISDSTVAPLYAAAVTASLAAAGFTASLVTFPAGERYKRLSTLSDLLEQIAENGLTRDDVIVALGGGVTGDMESNVARAIFGIPAVKGIEFGLGFEASRVRGSQDNDPYEVRDGRCVPRTNNAGGILGGITTGSPLFFRVGFKPISSIGLEQDSVDLRTMTPAKLCVRGRHDTCPATRAVPIVEAVCALVVLDSILTWPADPEATTRHRPQTA